ncbi:hypothetical protein SUGI_0852610 [Cryptomeria japonica]|nr:hypothetical protein SUGI_0852610 [Cryptomeria japonica]
MTSSLQSPLEDGLPVIDISQFPQEIDGDSLQYHPEIVKLGKACEKWWIFRLMNHGVPQDLLQNVLSVSQDLVSMSMELKDSVTTSNPGRSYNRAPGVHLTWLTCPIQIQSLNCLESYSPRKETLTSGSEVIGAFRLLLSDLAQRITKLILVSLGLDAETFYHSDFEEYRGCLTTLHNDKEGGLEVRSKDGKWVNIKPSPNSLIVNLGISLKAWANGRYRCAVHRVNCKGWQKRLSVPLFYSFARNAQISVPEVLVSEDNPRGYKPFYFQ